MLLQHWRVSKIYFCCNKRLVEAFDRNIVIFRTTVVTYWISDGLKINSDFPVRFSQPRQLCYCHLSALLVGRAGCRRLSLRWPSETVHLTFTLPDNIVHSITSPQKRTIPHLWRDDNLADTSERHFHSVAPGHFFHFGYSEGCSELTTDTWKINSYNCSKINGRHYHSVKIISRWFLAFILDWVSLNESPNFERCCSSPPGGAQYSFCLRLCEILIFSISLHHNGLDQNSFQLN